MKKIILLAMFVHLSAWANYLLKANVDVTVNLKNCQKAGYLAEAYNHEDEWVIDLIRNDSQIKRLHTKDFSGTRLDELTTKKYSFQTQIFSDLAYSFRLRELDYGIYGEDDLYLLEDFTPSYLINKDLTCLETKSCPFKTAKFEHIIVNPKNEKEVCLKANFLITF